MFSCLVASALSSRSHEAPLLPLRRPGGGQRGRIEVKRGTKEGRTEESMENGRTKRRNNDEKR